MLRWRGVDEDRVCGACGGTDLYALGEGGLYGANFHALVVVAKT
jgi:hypothetical protein